MSHAQWTTYKARLDSVAKDPALDAKGKHNEMDKVDKEFGVGHTISDETAPSGSYPTADPLGLFGK
jgi:hypothetical protein